MKKKSVICYYNLYTSAERHTQEQSVERKNILHNEKQKQVRVDIFILGKVKLKISDTERDKMVIMYIYYSEFC